MPHAQSAATIYYDDCGQGEPALLFTPGWCATREAYGRLPDLCAAHRRMLALDWRSAQPESFAYIVAHALKLVGGACGGFVAQLRSLQGDSE
jgi:hypothetical protein